MEAGGYRRKLGCTIDRASQDAGHADFANVLVTSRGLP